MGIDIKTSIRTTSSLNLLWCVDLVTNLATMPNTDTKFKGIPPRASQANYTTPSDGWNCHNWLIKSKAAHHNTSDLNNLGTHSEYNGNDDIIIGHLTNN